MAGVIEEDAAPARPVAMRAAVAPSVSSVAASSSAQPSVAIEAAKRELPRVNGAFDEVLWSGAITASPKPMAIGAAVQALIPPGQGSVQVLVAPSLKGKTVTWSSGTRMSALESVMTQVGARAALGGAVLRVTDGQGAMSAILGGGSSVTTATGGAVATPMAQTVKSFVFNASPEDRFARVTLGRWAKEAGWVFKDSNWQGVMDIPVEGEMTYTTDFQSAVLAYTAETVGRPGEVRPCFYLQNKTLLILPATSYCRSESSDAK